MQSIRGHYEAIAEAVQNAPVNYIDKTSWKRNKTLEWLWVMGNRTAAFFMLHRVCGSRTGKTHMATALGLHLVQKNKRVRYFDAVNLVNTLEQEKMSGNGGKFKVLVDISIYKNRHAP